MPEPEVERRQSWRWLFWFAPFVLLLWATQVTWPSCMRSGEFDLDDGWMRIKGWELLHPVRLGVDSVFTFGRLGYFFDSTYYPELWTWKILGFETLFKLPLCVFVALPLLRSRNLVARVVFGAGSLLLFPAMDGLAFLGIIALGTWRLGEPRPRAWVEMLVALLLVVLALVKFTFLVGAGASVLIVALALLLDRDHRGALRHLVLHVVVFAMAWIVLGQSLLDLPAFLRTSIWVARGYNESMGSVGDPRTLIAAGIALFLIGSIVLFELAREQRTARRVAAALVVLLVVFVAFKAGFTRHGGNSITFFAVVVPATFHLLPHGEQGAPPRRWLAALLCAARAALIPLGVVAIAIDFDWWPHVSTSPIDRVTRQVEGTLHNFTHLGALRQELEGKERAWRRLLALPRIVKTIGSERADVFSYSQARLFLSDIAYQPRPVIQGYSAYTSELARLNADFYASERAPRFVLLMSQTSDERWPCSEDALAFEELLRRYHPVLSEGGFLLMERGVTAPPAPAPRAVLYEADVAWHEWVDLDRLKGRCLVLKLTFTPSLQGRIASFFLRTPAIWADAAIDDNDPTPYRLIPGTAHDGIIARPLLASHDTLAQFLCGLTTQGVKRFRLRLPPGSENAFTDRVHVQVEDASDLVPPEDRTHLAEFRWGMLHPAPAEVGGPLSISSQTAWGREVLLVHAPSHIRWELEPGRWRITGQYALLKDAWKQGCTDGAGFRAVIVEASGAERVVFERQLDPRGVETDRQLQELDLGFDLPAGAHFELRTDPGPKDDSSCDWCCWARVEITRP